MKRSLIPVIAVLSALFLLAQPLFASPICHYVDNVGDCNGLRPCYPTIREAVDAADAFDIVSIFPGVYHEAVIIEGKDHLTLRAMDMMQKPVVAAPPESNAIVAMSSPNLKIVNLNLEAPDGAGLLTLDSATGDVEFRGNEVRSANGIQVRICAGGFVNSNRVNGGHIYSSAGAMGCRIEQNTLVSGNIVIEEASVAVSGNSIRSNALLGGGVRLSGATVGSNAVNGNVIDHGGVVIEGFHVSRNVVRNNTIRGGWGITLDGGVTGNVIETNFMSGSGADGIHVHAVNPGEPNRIRNNTSVENDGCDLNDTSTPSIDNVWTGNRFVTSCGSVDG